MKSGICYPSYGRDAAWSAGGGSTGVSSDFPMQNLALIDEPRRVTMNAASGTQNYYFDLGAVRTVDFIAFIHHNAPGAAIFGIDLYAGANQTGGIVYTSVGHSFWPGGVANTDYPAVRPFRFDAVAARSGLISVSSNASPWEIGGVEIGQFWEWDDVSVPSGIGIESRSAAQEMGGGIDHVTQQWGPRIATGARELVDLDEVDTTLLDFHRARGRSQAFVWCWDVDDPATWARQAFLARNRTLPPGVAVGYEVGSMSYDFEEHLA